MKPAELDGFLDGKLLSCDEDPSLIPLRSYAFGDVELMSSRRELLSNLLQPLSLLIRNLKIDKNTCFLTGLLAEHGPQLPSVDLARGEYSAKPSPLSAKFCNPCDYPFGFRTLSGCGLYY